MTPCSSALHFKQLPVPAASPRRTGPSANGEAALPPNKTPSWARCLRGCQAPASPHQHRGPEDHGAGEATQAT
eukprot:15560270-Heterocapsa_arctica.AAC.1